MNPTMAHKSPQPTRQGFAIFDDGSPASKDKHTTWTAAADSAVLRELSKGKIQNRAVPVLDAAASPLTKSPRRESPCLEVKPTKAEYVRLTVCDQQSQAHSESFEPLVAVPEESSLVELETGDAVAVQSPAKSGENRVTSSQLDEARQMLLITEPNLSLEEQVDKHLAGQFEWIMEYPAGVASRVATDGIVQSGQGPSSTNAVYGCNVLPVRRQQGASQTAELSTDTFTILATVLTKDSCHYPLTAEHKDLVNPSTDHLRHLPLPTYPETALKVGEGVAEVKQAVSPALSMERERTECVAGGSIISARRIEDSFEELDRLEDELEAVREVTRTHHHATGREKVLVQASPGNAKMKTPIAKVNKRVSIAGYSATVRVKPSQEKPPSSRRSASLTLRDARALQQGLSSEGSRVEPISCQGQRVANRLSTTPKPLAKSSKPRTVANFELPGEAVARRLKEQREARLAQQAEAQKALASPAPKPRCHKSLALPTFELPGEAISRRKREGLEAKLRAQEEETKKRREFKARPLRQSMAPAVTPRETLTSRVRQSKPLPGATGEEDVSQKQTSLGCVRDHARASLTTAKNKSSQPRIRTAHSGAKSVSTGSGSGQRNSASLEELTVQRQQGRLILSKDKSIAQDKKKDKQERELTAKTAREQAADRSRMASRELAEKVRRKGLVGKQAKENRDDQKGTQA
ncbi:hypothetical protein E4U17_000665 [Claviceps sp. LM77 group G4]|nr:hypothetical protein E4U17_000665 [Claviceps sp. LM77 group G4]KAG6050721.1 hypothetical protein E4U33_000678 [Claviceps sp. LM78 group G4]KAG6083493.1 hypothetical protein E4U16_004045 [Claviceps sp. LM84 group G4]